MVTECVSAFSLVLTARYAWQYLAGHDLGRREEEGGVFLPRSSHARQGGYPAPASCRPRGILAHSTDLLINRRR